MDTFNAAICNVRRRLAIQRGLRYVFTALTVAVSAGVLWVLVAKLFPMAGPPHYGVLPLAALGLVAGLGLAWLRRPSELETALEIDKRLGLKERVTSSIQLRDSDNPMAPLLHEDAQRRLANLDAGNAFPYRIPRSLRWLAVPAVLLGAAWLALPEFDLFDYRERQALARAERMEAKANAERIREAAQPLEKAAGEGLEDAERLEGELQRIAEALEQGELSKKLAAAKLQDIRDTLEEKREDLAGGDQMPRFAKAGEEGASREQDEASGQDGAQEGEQGRQQSEEGKQGAKKSGEQALPNMMKQQSPLSEALRKQDFEAAAKELEKLKKQLENNELSKEQREQLAKQCESLCKQAGKQGQNSRMCQSLSQLASALQSNPSLAAKAAAAAQLSAEDLARLQRQMAQLRECSGKLGQCQGGLLGDSELAALNRKFGQLSSKPGGRGAGMGPNEGQGAGGEAEAYQRPNAQLNPEMLPGEVDQGEILMSIMERTSPEAEDAQSSAGFSESLTAVQREAEQALTHEEIPQGSKEFVRQYFGSLGAEETREEVNAE